MKLGDNVVEVFAKNASDVLNEMYCWQVVHGEYFSVDAMTDQELQEAIINDILQVTMLEKETGKKCNFTEKTLVRFLCSEQKERVVKMLAEVMGLVELVETTPDNFPNFSVEMSKRVIKRHGYPQLRIRDNRVILQEAMNFAGYWFDGFSPPEGVQAFSINMEKVNAEVEKYGSFHNFIDSLAMDIAAGGLNTSSSSN